jgi:hypothetical protein
LDKCSLSIAETFIPLPRICGGRGCRGGGKNFIFKNLSPHLDPLPQGERNLNIEIFP